MGRCVFVCDRQRGRTEDPGRRRVTDSLMLLCLLSFPHSDGFVRTSSTVNANDVLTARLMSHFLFPVS